MGIFIGMSDIENKGEIITQLFLYYKPILSKEKQHQLLRDWLSSCLQYEEYEMASTIKLLISGIEDDIDDEFTDTLIDHSLHDIDLVYDHNFISGKLPKIVTKKDKNYDKIGKKSLKTPKKRWKFTNMWVNLHDVVIIEFQLSPKKKVFRLIIINYCVEYS